MIIICVLITFFQKLTNFQEDVERFLQIIEREIVDGENPDKVNFIQLP
jgi:hypothetical protein